MRTPLVLFGIALSMTCLPAQSGLGAPPPAEAANCGSTVQTFWHADLATGKLLFKELVRHDEEICNPDKLLNQTATAELLDRKNQVIRRIPVYVQTAIYGETGTEKHPSPKVIPLRQFDFQLKFADTAVFQRAVAMKIKFLNGETCGPAHF